MTFLDVLIAVAAFVVILPVAGALLAFAGFLISAGYVAVADRLFP